MKNTENWFVVLAAFMLGISIGNYGGDQKTISDCASFGEGKMVGGTKIKCEVIREVKA